MDEGGVHYYAALYGLVSCLLVMLVVLLLYVACSRRYKLNWFEKNLLEAATELSRESLLVRSPQPGTTPTTTEHDDDDEKGDFWVPSNLQRQGSADHTSGEESVPGPSTPVVEEPVTPCVEPVVRSEKLVVLSSVPRPHVASMQTRLDHTKIKPALYQTEHINDGGDEDEDHRGAVHLSLAYDPAAGILTVRLLEAHDLQARDFSGTADPYAKIRLLPDRSNVWQTRIHKRTLNPVFDEDFVFEVRPHGLGRRVLEIILYDFDAYSRHHSIGGVKLPMSQIDLCQKITLWKALGPCSEQDSKAELGDLMVSMAYLPSAERLTIVIMKARNLRVIDDTRLSSDPFVKVALIQAGKRVKKKKTGVHRNTLSPIFNEALTFDIGRDALARTTIEFLVMHDSLLGPSELLGRVVIGPGADARPHERDLHHQLLTFNKPSASITEWLPLSDPQ